MVVSVFYTFCHSCSFQKVLGLLPTLDLLTVIHLMHCMVKQWVSPFSLLRRFSPSCKWFNTFNLPYSFNKHILNNPYMTGTILGSRKQGTRQTAFARWSLQSSEIAFLGYINIFRVSFGNFYMPNPFWRNTCLGVLTPHLLSEEVGLDDLQFFSIQNFCNILEVGTWFSLIALGSPTYSLSIIILQTILQKRHLARVVTGIGNE